MEGGGGEYGRVHIRPHSGVSYGSALAHPVVVTDPRRRLIASPPLPLPNLPFPSLHTGLGPAPEAEGGSGVDVRGGTVPGQTA